MNVIESCVKLGKHLKCYCRHIVVNHLAVMQYSSGGGNFKDGNTRVIDKARSGRPSTAVKVVNIAKAAELLGNDRRLTLHELSVSLNITHLRGAMRKKRLDLLKKQFFLFQHNARPHIADVALAALTDIGGTALQYPPYSPELAPCDFWAFPTLQRQLRGKMFPSDDEVRNATTAVLKGMSQNNLFRVFETLIKRCKKCIQCEGRYFEKEKILGPVVASDSDKKISIVTFQSALVLIALLQRIEKCFIPGRCL